MADQDFDGQDVQAWGVACSRAQRQAAQALSRDGTPAGAPRFMKLRSWEAPRSDPAQGHQGSCRQFGRAAEGAVGVLEVRGATESALACIWPSHP
jgi:hypothetical protein